MKMYGGVLVFISTRSSIFETYTQKTLFFVLFIFYELISRTLIQTLLKCNQLLHIATLSVICFSLTLCFPSLVTECFWRK